MAAFPLRFGSTTHRQRRRLLSSLFCIYSLLSGTGNKVAGAYSLKRDLAAEDNASFSEDFDEILNVANNLAENDRNDTVAQEFHDEHTFSCSDSFDQADLISFTYAIVVEESFEPEGVQNDLEVALNRFLASSFLSCDSRQLQSIYQEAKDVGVVGVNSLPRDEISTQGNCASFETTGACSLVYGWTWLFVSSDSDLSIVRFYALSMIGDFLSVASQYIEGLLDAALLSPEVPIPASSEQEQKGNQGISPQSGFSTKSVVVVSVVAFVFVVCVVSYAKYMRVRSRARCDKEEIQNAPTAEDNESLSANGDSSSPLSPFSKMLPAAYQLGEPSLEVILEESTSAEGCESIVVSEGYYTEDDFTEDEAESNCSHFSATPVLGARRRRTDETCCMETEQPWSETESNKGSTLIAVCEAFSQGEP